MNENLQFENQLRIVIANSIKSLYGETIEINSISFQETKKEFKGDITLVVFPYTKLSKKSPEETANDIGNFILSGDFPLKEFNVVKGFLNLVISEDYWLNFFAEVHSNPHKLFHPDSVRGERAAGFFMVEYSSPNTNKPIHLGHVRNNLLGYSVSEILKANGHKVVMANLVNDRGIHICKSMLAWKKFGNDESPASSGIKGDHLVGKYYVMYDKKFREQVEQLEKQGMPKEEAEKKAPMVGEVEEMLRMWEAGDKETIDLWKMMNGWVYDGFAITYDKLGVYFDKMYYESDTYLLGKKIVEEGIKQNVFQKSADGAVRIDLTDVGLDQKVLMRSDGTSVYMTQDLGTASLRFEEYPGLQKLIYVVGNEQEYHFKVLKEIFRKMKRPWAEGLYHLSYGMVDLPSGKMKSREGTVVDADDLINEIVEQAEMTTKAQGKLEDYDNDAARELYHTIGMGALKYYILKVDPKKRMLFNPAESIDLNGNTGPFIQYTFARIQSVLRKGKSANASTKFGNHSMSAEEKKLVQLIYMYPQIIAEAGENLSPALVANYCYDLAKAYNHFYHDHVVVDAENPEVTAFRLSLSEMTSLVIKRALELLGIKAPERM